jgi:outer membrane protein assembly factor BamB/tRNA A-37 threonylcarbamoyl transferase component Bud32
MGMDETQADDGMDEASAGGAADGAYRPGSNDMNPTDGRGGAQGPYPTAYLPKNEITTLALGTVLQGRYQIESVLGAGGMGAVYKVRDLRFAGAIKYCALKEMLAKFTDTMDQRSRLSNFEREANILASLSHPAIPSVHDFFAEHSRAYLVLAYVEGRDLEKLLKDTPGLLSEQVVGSWAIQVCDVLHYLHTHKPPIIFRDLKPQNLMLTPANQVVLIDFGIAKVFERDKKGTMVGTEGYSPPEQYRGSSDARSDLYSLGATMHHLLTRSDPRLETPFTFAERMPSSLNPAVTPAMEAVIMRCVEYDPDQRYRDALELRGALEDALDVFSLGTGHFRAGSGSGRSSPLSRHAGNSGLATILPGSGALAGTGLVWKFQTEDEVRSSAMVSAAAPAGSAAGSAAGGATVYIGSYDHYLYALDARSGEMQWRFPTDDGICATPALWKQLVIVGSEDFNVYAVQAATGQEAWTYRTWQHVRASPRVYGEALYVGSDDGFLHALEPRSGRPLWKFRAWRPVRSSAAYADGLLYFGSDDERVYAVDALTGQEKWRFAALGGVTSSPAVGNGLVYVGSLDFVVYALDAKMGWVAWRERTTNFVVSSPCVVGERIYIGSVDQHLYCLDGKTGRAVWKYQAGGQITSSPTVVKDVVYFGCVDGAVYALEAGTGRLRWRFQTEGAVPSSPVVAEGVVYIGSLDGCVYALRA